TQEELVANLDSPKDSIRWRALQTLADVYQHPFGYITCWPLRAHHAKQLGGIVALYKEWCKVKSTATEPLVIGGNTQVKFQTIDGAIDPLTWGRKQKRCHSCCPGPPGRLAGLHPPPVKPLLEKERAAKINRPFC